MPVYRGLTLGYEEIETETPVYEVVNHASMDYKDPNPASKA